MPGKVMKLINKTLHADGYYTASISTSETAATQKTPHIKLWFRFDKGLIIGPEQREKLIREEQEQAAAAAAAVAKAKEEIPTPGVVLLVKESVEAKTTTAAVSTHHHHHHADSTSSSSDYSSSSTFQSKLDVTKRNIHDSYQQLANAKKQRMIQVIDPRDLPPPQSSSKGKGAVNVASRKKMIITKNRKIRNFFDGEERPKLMKPTSIF